jgi:hypothetical protein
MAPRRKDDAPDADYSHHRVTKEEQVCAFHKPEVDSLHTPGTGKIDLLHKRINETQNSQLNMLSVRIFKIVITIMVTVGLFMLGGSFTYAFFIDKKVDTLKKEMVTKGNLKTTVQEAIREVFRQQ